MFFKKKPIINANKTTIQQYYSIKQKLQLPLKIKIFFDLLQNHSQQVKQKHKISKQINDIYKQFSKCFIRLEFQEKYYFMLALIKISKSIIQTQKQYDNFNNDTNIQEYECKIQNIQTSCKIKDVFMGLSVWQQRIFKFLNKQKIIKLLTITNNTNHSNHQNNPSSYQISTSKQILISLCNYHLRHSSQKNTLILQSIFDQWNIQQKYQKIYIYFKEKDLFNQIYNNVKNAIIMTWKKRLVGMLNLTQSRKDINGVININNNINGNIKSNETNRINNMDSINSNSNHNNNINNLINNHKKQQTLIPTHRILTSKTINQYFKTKQKIQKQMQNKKLKFKVSSQIRKIKIYRSSKYQNLYKAQNIIQSSYQQILKNTELISLNPNNKLTHYQKMESFSASISAVYYKYVVKGCTHEIMSIVEENIKQTECKITFKAIQNYILQKNVDFLQIKVHKISSKKTKIQVFGFVNFDQNKKLNPISVNDFILSIIEYQPVFNSNMNSMNNFNNTNIVFNKSNNINTKSNISKLSKNSQLNHTPTIINQYTTFQYPSSKIQSSNRIDEQHLQQYSPHQSQQQQQQDDFHTVIGQNFSDQQQDKQFQMCNTFPSPNKKSEHNNKNNQSDEEQTQEERNVITEFRNQKSINTNNNTINNSQREIYDLIGNANYQSKITQKNIKNGKKQISTSSYLNKKSYILPLGKTQPKDILKKHYFQGQWSKYQKGGVFCLNTALIDKQKQIFKSFLARMGNALMKKSFSNLSLPVIVFKPQSQLQTIARNLSYAPLLLQHLHTSSIMQKMKKSIIFMISMGTIGLSLQKPFNPIIGQTYQGFIDNCPIYLQQIQHHPAITTMYFVGRGYKIYGSVIPSISIRLNSVKCFSEAPIKIEFQNEDNNGNSQSNLKQSSRSINKNNDLIQFTPGKMLIGGFLVGDRTFDFTDTIFMYDVKNKVIAQILFGPRKNFTKNMRCEKNDFISGYIFTVSQQFIFQFTKQHHNLSPSTDKNSIIVSQIYGCWHQKIFIDNQLYFDFRTDLPYNLIRDKIPLRSDSTFRMDIKYLEKDNLEKAQDEKDKIQDIQRNDNKLRKKGKAQKGQKNQKK